jgi:FtsP/CotA-like multicopper oxidase with cupredoxin domain
MILRKTKVALYVAVVVASLLLGLNPVLAAAMRPGDTPNYFGPEGNWAFSPIPTVTPASGSISQSVTGGIRKFIDTLPGLGITHANSAGQYIPVAIADQATYPGSDYYVIGLKDHSEKMHLDLAPTKTRGYYQINTTDTSVSALHYAGPMIIAKRDVPTRVLFINQLDTGVAGNLFIPVDITSMGAGMGPDGMNIYTQNRAVIHLHGGNTPWISDGTPHQWTTPANETSTIYQKGDSFRNVPDMVGAGLTPGGVPKSIPNPTSADGMGTYYYTNQQSSRLMFYHDHSLGTTRLNVYAGGVAPYLVWDQFEEDLISGTNSAGANTTHLKVLPDLGGVYHYGIPLIIQDKTFVDADRIADQDPTWNSGTTAPTPHTGDLWFPHVYMPNQNPNVDSGANDLGRWDYGPWFWPPLTTAAGLIHGEAILPDGTRTPGTPNPTMVPESYMDTPLVNGAAYPTLTVTRTAYRFRILNGCNDRYLNLQLYYAEPLSVAVAAGGSGYSPTPTVTFTGGGATTQATATAAVTYSVASIGLTSSGSGYTSVPVVTLVSTSGAQATASATVSGGVVTGVTVTNGGIGYATPPTVVFTGGGASVQATATAAVSGMITSITLTGTGSGYTSAPTVTITDSSGTGAAAVATINTEVKMVPAVPHPFDPTWPPTWPTDGRPEGVPDPTTAGPDIIMIGTEGGFLATPVDIPSTPIGYEYNRRNIVVLNVSTHALYVGPAERVDIIVDFSQIPASADTVHLIFYNDAPAPVPAFDPRNDYFTGDPDHTVATGDGSGGAPTTLPGYGPNTRTLMRFDVSPGTPAPAPYDMAALQTALAATYGASQEPAIVPQTTFPAPNHATADTYARIQDTSLTFGSNGPSAVSSLALTASGSGYITAPTVTITGTSGTGATASAGLTGVVKALTVTNPGSGYSGTPTVTITGGGGTGATATTTISGTVSSLTLTNSGANYTSLPTVTFSGGGGTGAAATATLRGGVQTVTMTNSGTGYTFAPTVKFTGGGGSGAAGTANRTGVLKTVTIGWGGSGYTSAPTVSFTGGNGSGATATATVSGGKVTGVTITNKGSGYTFAPTVHFTGGGGSNASAFATVTNVIRSITITNAGTGYTSAPTVAITSGGGSGATATAAIGGSLARLTLTNGGTGYTSAPTVGFTGGGGTGAAATAAINANGIGALTLTSSGSGYTSPPTVTITGGGGSGAAATASITGVVNTLTVLSGGSGYAGTLTVTFSGGGGTGAAATATTSTTIDMKPKAIQELFELNYGRMNATLGVELPFTNFQIQTTIPLGYIDPPTDIIKDGETQIWKITHNGVDTHVIHFHLVNVQVINRVGWDGMITPPEPEEMGWKETVKMNPLQDCIVAMKAVKPTLPWPVPDSTRYLDVTMPPNMTGNLTQINPADNTPMVVTNVLTNFGWEYVWHCHILGHEENDMMRPLVFLVNPDPPVLAAAIGSPPLQVDLTWTGLAPNATGFQIQRATITGSTTGSFNTLTTAGASVTAYADTGVTINQKYVYQAIAVNGTNGWYKSVPSNPVIVSVSAPAAPSGLTATPSALSVNLPTIALSWTDNANGAGPFTIQRATNNTFGSGLTTFGTGVGITTFTDTSVAATRTTYYYRVAETNVIGASAWSTPPAQAIDPGQLPAAPINLVAGTRQRTSIAMSWTANLTAGPVTSYTIQRSTAGPTGPWTNVGTTFGSTVTFTNFGLTRNRNYWYQVQAVNAAGAGAFSTPLATSTLP